MNEVFDQKEEFAMSLFTRASSHYLKVLSPYVSLGEKEVFFVQPLAVSEKQNRIDDTDYDSLWLFKRFRKKSFRLKSLICTAKGCIQRTTISTNKVLSFNTHFYQPLINSFQGSQFFLTLNGFSLNKLSTKAKLVFEIEDMLRHTSENKKGVKRIKKTTIAFSLTPRKKYYKRVRPLLSINRFDIQNLCLLWRLPIYPDRSNKQFIQSRNRIRKQLLPIIRFYFNPQIETVLFQFTEILNEEHSYLERLTYFLVNEGPSFALSSTLTLDSLTQRDKEETSTPDELRIYDLQPVFKRIDILYSQRLYPKDNVNQKQEYNINRKDVSSLYSIPIVFRRRVLKVYLESFIGKNKSFSYIERVLFLFKQLFD